MKYHSFLSNTTALNTPTQYPYDVLQFAVSDGSDALPLHLKSIFPLSHEANAQKRFQPILKRIPAGRWGAPDKHKRLVVYLASDAARYMYRAIISIDACSLIR